ncbi:DUF5052 family protein [Firmicutes bacterium AF25-13AC]|jgi:hypothetical protein|nr:DUF5052 family protein [Firmicutes bacterium AF25-13AC]
MNKKQKGSVWLLALVAMISIFVVSGCAKLASAINDIKGSLIGNQYTIYTYDNFGNLVLETSGKKIDIAGNPVKTTSYDENGKVITGYELSSVITITIDGNEIESCGDTCIFVQKGLTPDVDFTTETIKSSSGIFDITSISAKLNQYKNKFGKARVVVIKSQLGNPIMAFSGDSVYWEIPEDLPKMTKLMIDGKALYIHRANFQIVDKELIE